MNDWLKQRHFGRCERKKAYRTADLADKLAQLASEQTGELIISYRCFDCGRWHIGHADESQIAARHPRCAGCGREIPPHRHRIKLQEMGEGVIACSERCARNARKRRKLERSKGVKKPPL